MSPPQVGIGPALEVAQRLQAALGHPLRLALHPGHLPHDVLVEALLRFEDVKVLDIAPAQLVAAQVKFLCCISHRASLRRDFSYVDSNNPAGLAGPARPRLCLAVSAGARRSASADGACELSRRRPPALAHGHSSPAISSAAAYGGVAGSPTITASRRSCHPGPERHGTAAPSAPASSPTKHDRHAARPRARAASSGSAVTFAPAEPTG